MRPRRPTLREIAEQVRRDAEARPAVAPEDVRYGTFDAHGRLYSPAGVPIAEVERITPSDAGRRVAAGALLAFEGCGCGGSCGISWFGPAEVAATGSTNPRFVKGYGSPTWIDRWSGDGVDVVFAHGDVRWGDLLV